MARTPRKKAQSGIYHIFLRPVKERGFLTDDEDSRLFLDALGLEMTRDAMGVFAYYIDNGKIHLAVREGLEGVTTTLMRVCRDFSLKLNAKYNLSGKLFRGRFLSEPLETPGQLLDCTRFIHRLPLKYGGGLNYENSSYGSYFIDDGFLTSDEVIAICGSKIDYRIYCDLPYTGKYLGDTFDF